MCVYLHVCHFVSACLCKCEFMSGVCLSVCTKEEAVPCPPQEKCGNPIQVSSLLNAGLHSITRVRSFACTCVEASSLLLTSCEKILTLIFNSLTFKYTFKSCRLCVNEIIFKKRKCSLTQNLSIYTEFPILLIYLFFWADKLFFFSG